MDASELAAKAKAWSAAHEALQPTELNKEEESKELVKKGQQNRKKEYGKEGHQAAVAEQGEKVGEGEVLFQVQSQVGDDWAARAKAWALEQEKEKQQKKQDLTPTQRRKRQKLLSGVKMELTEEAKQWAERAKAWAEGRAVGPGSTAEGEVEETKGKGEGKKTEDEGGGSGRGQEEGGGHREGKAATTDVLNKSDVSQPVDPVQDMAERAKQWAASRLAVPEAASGTPWQESSSDGGCRGGLGPYIVVGQEAAWDGTMPAQRLVHPPYGVTVVYDTTQQNMTGSQLSPYQVPQYAYGYGQLGPPYQ